MNEHFLPEQIRNEDEQTRNDDEQTKLEDEQIRIDDETDNHMPYFPNFSETEFDGR